METQHTQSEILIRLGEVSALLKSVADNCARLRYEMDTTAALREQRDKEIRAIETELAVVKADLATVKRVLYGLIALVATQAIGMAFTYLQRGH